MGVGAGLYMCDVVKKFTFAISSPDEFLYYIASCCQVVCCQDFNTATVLFVTFCPIVPVFFFVLISQLCCIGDICRDDTRAVSCPTLILHGSADPLVPRFHPEFLLQNIKNSRQGVIFVYFSAVFKLIVVSVVMF